MLELQKNEMPKIEYLCRGMDDICLWSCIQGHMGRAWADNISQPKYAKVIVADFCYLLGCTEDADQAKAVIHQMAAECKGKLLVIKDEIMRAYIQEICANRFQKMPRYIMRLDRNHIDINQLTHNTMAIPGEYRLQKIDGPLYYRVFEKDWTLDLCSNFASEADFLKNGIGYVVMFEQEIVSGVSSYSYSDEGIEITIGTAEGHRRKGLALACASKLMIDCVQQNKYPRWEAANLNSVALAEKLGYSLEQEYTGYMIR